jgi:hypothetical protein
MLVDITSDKGGLLRDRLWLIILPLAWIGKWGIGVPGWLPVQQVPSQMIGVLVEDLIAWVVHQAHRPALRPHRGAHSRRRHRKRGGKRTFRHWRAPTIDEEKQKAQPEEARQVKSNSVLDPQRSRALAAVAYVPSPRHLSAGSSSTPVLDMYSWCSFPSAGWPSTTSTLTQDEPDRAAVPAAVGLLDAACQMARQSAG